MITSHPLRLMPIDTLNSVVLQLSPHVSHYHFIAPVKFLISAKCVIVELICNWIIQFKLIMEAVHS